MRGVGRELLRHPNTAFCSLDAAYPTLFEVDGRFRVRLDGRFR
jgi:hypothetical protein